MAQRAFFASAPRSLRFHSPVSCSPPLSLSLVLSTPPSKVDGVAGDGWGKEKRLARKRGETNGSFNIAAKSTKPSVADGARFFTAINSDCGS